MTENCLDFGKAPPVMIFVQHWNLFLVNSHKSLKILLASSWSYAGNVDILFFVNFSHKKINNAFYTHLHNVVYLH